MLQPDRNPRTTLTNTAIERLLPGEQLRDERVLGLHIRAHASGRSFMLYYRFLGQPRRPKIGDYGAIGISQAREIAREMLGQVAAGKDPAQLRTAARGEPTVAELWQRVCEEHYARGKRWDGEAKRLYAKHVDRRIGQLKVSAATYSAVAAVHSSMKKYPVEANRTIAILSKMFDLAEKWEMRPLGSNPCRHISRYQERSRRRFATAEELAKIGPILEREAATQPAGVAFLYLMLYSGARPSEIERVTWGQLNGSVLRIPDGKTGHRNVYLPPPAMAVVLKLQKQGQKSDQRIIGQKLPRRLWRRIRDEVGCGDLWARDLRRTFATVGLSKGVTLGMLGELLGHSDPKTTMVYAKLMEDAASAASATIAGGVAELLKPKEKYDARVDFASVFDD